MATDSMITPRSNDLIYDGVQSHYATAAQAKDDNYSRKVAEAFGYSAEELAGAAEGSNLGLSCGNPFAIAKLREGETVVDLGSGAGFDVFQAAKKVGQSGRVVGVDMNEDMLARAHEIKQKNKADNVSFVRSRITQIDIPSDSTDCVLSNCVINLVPEDEKPLVFEEMYRILKQGGRLAISDILLKQQIGDDLKQDMALYAGCISGASLKEGYERYLRDAGFADVMILGDDSDLNVYKTGESTGCCGPQQNSSSCGGGSNGVEMLRGAGTSVRKLDLNTVAGSYKIYAVKRRDTFKS